MFDPKQGPKLNRYLKLLNAGTPSIDAARDAFGDLRALDKALNAYLRRSTLPGMRIALSKLTTPVVKVRPLTTGERALIELRMQSTRGVDRKTGAALWAKAARIAPAASDDAVAQGWLAEMAYDADEDAASESAADRALAIEPASAQALLYKARVHLRRAATAKATDPSVWREARSWIIKANKADPDNAQALSMFYQSYEAANAKPTASAVAGLRRALELVPQDTDLRFAVARYDVLTGAIDAARDTLRPIAFDPHGGGDNPATRLLAALDAGKRGQAALDTLKPAN